MPCTPGAYILLFRLEGCEVTVGRLGTFVLPSGRYAYVGSAQGGLEARVARHLKGSGKKHWHIDFLLDQATERTALLVPSTEDLECPLARSLMETPGVTVPIPRFGSSDCRCLAHLFFLKKCQPERLHLVVSKAIEVTLGHGGEEKEEPVRGRRPDHKNGSAHPHGW